MKILFLASWFPSRVYPTHGNFVAKHARLVAKHHEVAVVNIQDDQNLRAGQFELEVGIVDGYLLVQVYFGQSPSMPQWRKIYYRYQAYEKARKYILHDWKTVDFIHAHVLLDAGMIGRSWARKFGVPFVITEHSTAYHSPEALTGLRRILGKMACQEAAFILPVSEHLGRGMREINGLAGNYRQVSNVVNTQLFRHVPPPDGNFIFLHVSNFVDEHKNITGLLAAFAEVTARTNKIVHLRLAGDGDLNELRQRIKAAGLSKWEVTVTGPHTEEEIAEEMQKCHAFVLPSNYENEPVVLLEAQASGRPCIATRTGGIPEIVADANCGELVEVGDGKALVAAMLMVVTNYESYDQLRIRERAVKRCSEEAVLENLEAVYKECLG